MYWLAGNLNAFLLKIDELLVLFPQVEFADQLILPIALAIVVENAGFGSAHAAPIARRVFDYVLLGQYPSEADIAAVQQGQATAPIGEPRAVADVPLIRTVDPTTSE